MAAILKRATTWVVTVFLCIGFAIAQPKGEEKGSQSKGDFSGSAVLEQAKKLGITTQTATASLLLYEKSVSQEVGRGVTRLTRSCSGLSSGNTPPNEATQTIQTQLALVQQQKAQTLRKLNEVAVQVNQAKEAQCKLTFLPFLKSASCQAASELQLSTEQIQQATSEYFGLVEERYKLYFTVAAAEARSCVRPGFTERILRANEEHMTGQESRARQQFLDLLQSVGELAKTLN